MKKAPLHWMDLSVDERKTAVAEVGLPKFRASQISNNWFGRLNSDPGSWTDLPKDMRSSVADRFFPELMEPISTQTADEGQTVKVAWRGVDGSIVESVLMAYPNRVTLCISSEAGCGMGCPFCATGQGGLQRNLSAAEILQQLMVANQQLAAGLIPGNERVSNIVFMGMGEPMANYKAVMQAIHAMTTPKPDGFGMSARGITVSTVGLVPRMKQLAEEGMQFNLALSLHAPDDELRDELIPINKRYGVDETLNAAWNFAKVTGRRVSIEYAMMRDINDQAWRADLMAKKLKARGDWGWFHVNLIPLNPTPGSKWTASRKSDERAFIAHLENAGVPVTMRETRGQEIDGACGQLAAAVREGRVAPSAEASK